MERNFKNLFGLLGEPTVVKEISTITAFEETRGGQPKSYIPNYMHKPPFGYPRYEDLVYYRQLAESIYVDMCVNAIIDEVCAVEWDIVAEDRSGNEIPGKEKEIEKVKDFFYNPNTNKESWEMLVRMMLPDLLEINSGVMVKTFNAFGEMVELVSRNGSAFTKNPDIYGMYTNRADLILVENILNPKSETPNQFPLLAGYITETEVKEEAAYFQYGFNTGARPVPFGKREIVWFEKKLRTDKIYGRSAMGVLAKTVQTLIYAVEHNLEYFNDNSIPPGVLGIEGLNSDDMKAFGQQWVQQQRVKDSLGNWKKANHKLPMVNRMPKFERLGFTNAELELIESQKWWSKLVWATMGMTATELGFVEDSKGSANQIVQSSIAKKRIIYPLLKLIAYHVNTEIIPEFGFEGILYKYKIFDVDDETKKWGLYKLQTDAGLKTVNEVRNTEGLDPLDGGDETNSMRQDRQQTEDRETFSNEPLQQDADKINRDAQNERDKQTNKPKKPKEEKPDKKALTTDTPLTLQPNEELSAKKLKKAITDLLDKNEEKIIEVLESQGKPEQLLQIKSIDDLPEIIKKIFEIFTFKGIVNEVISVQFEKGWEKSEKQLDRNIRMNKHALQFLQDHTFDNIKDMTSEISNKLKGELSRGIINGESIPKLKKRVSKVFDVGNVRASAIARTEVNNCENQGKLLAMKESGLKMSKQWVATNDDRTCNSCKHLDGQTVGLDEYFHHKDWSGQSPPIHPNGRCTLLFVDVEK